jgi:hypothetical protein
MSIVLPRKPRVAIFLRFVAIGRYYCNHFIKWLQYGDSIATKTLRCNILDFRCNREVQLQRFCKMVVIWRQYCHENLALQYFLFSLQ